MDVLTFDKIADDLDAVLAICQSAGLTTNGTRMAIAAARIREIHRQLVAFRNGGPFPEIGGFRDVSLLIEGSEFATLLPCLGRWLVTDRDVVADKLKKVLSGPQLPTDEDANSNQARNFLFELTLGATLETRGRRVTQGEHPDLTLHLPARDLFTECKRPLSASKVVHNLNAAATQIQEGLGARGVPTSTFGLVALDVTKIVNLEYECCTFYGEAEITNSMARRLERVIEDTHDARQPFRTQRIIAVLYRFVTIGHDRLNNRYVTATLDALVPLAERPNTARHAAVEALKRAIGLAGSRDRAS